MRPHQDSLRRLLPLRRPDAEAMRQGGDLGNGEDGGSLLSMLRRTRVNCVKDEEKCDSESQQALIEQAGLRSQLT